LGNGNSEGSDGGAEVLDLKRRADHVLCLDQLLLCG
jgi:hypothetical protein